LSNSNGIRYFALQHIVLSSLECKYDEDDDVIVGTFSLLKISAAKVGINFQAQSLKKF